MDALSLALSPFIVSLLTNWFKTNATTEYTPGRTAAVRAVAAALSLAAAVASAYFLHTPFDSTIVGVAVSTLVNFIGSTGIFHLAANPSTVTTS